jgi:hypothetical protein
MPIMWGLAIGAAMGGGIAALRGGKTDDILKGAVMGGATGAIGGGISSLMPAATGGVAGAATVAPSTAVAGGATTIAPAATTVGTNLGTNLLTSSPGAATGILGGDVGSFIAADQAASQAASQAVAPANTGFFGSGIGKTIADNKGMIGLGGLGLLALKPQASGGGQEQDSFIRPYTFDPRNQIYTAKAPIKASEFGATTVAEGGAIRMAEGGETTQEVRENRTNPTLEALAAIQQAQQTYQPPSQGITQPFIQPQMAQIQQQYAAPQRQAPDAFQYQAPSFVKYANVGGGGIAGVGGGGGGAIDPITKQPVKTVAQIIAAKKPATGSGGSSGVFDTYGNEMGPNDIYSGPGYYERYPVAEVYNYETNQPTRPFNPNEGSPEFNVPSNVPVDPSSGMAEIQQMFANQGYTDFIPSASTDYYGNTGGDADGGLIADKHPKYAMGGGIGGYYPEPDDGNRNFGGIESLNQGPQYPMQGYAMGGHLGGYSDGGQLLRGPGDGVSDDIPAQIGNRQPARLADGEFVVPARIVSELGNGSTDAGAKRLYAMMDRIQKNRGKTVGKDKVAVNSRSDKYLPA